MFSAEQLSTAVWKKGDRSNGNGGNNCVEVAVIGDLGVAVRDSKDRSGPALGFTRAEWTAFLGSCRDGEFDLTPL